MLFFHLSEFQGKNVEIFVNKASGQLGVMYDGKAVGALSPVDTKQALQYLVNHDRIDLDEIAEGKRIKDSDDCTCTTLRDGVRYSSSCAKHFRV